MVPAELQNSCQLENILKNTKLPFITDLKQLHYADHISAKEAQLGKNCMIHSFKSLLKQDQHKFRIYHAFF